MKLDGVQSFNPEVSPADARVVMGWGPSAISYMKMWHFQYQSRHCCIWVGHGIIQVQREITTLGGMECG